MPFTPQVRFLPRARIDDDRWDSTVTTDAARLPYGHTWWLDAATDGRWTGLVLDDYRAVLALPVQRAFGPLRQLSRATFTQQCGPWGTFSFVDVPALLVAIPVTALHVRIPLAAGITADCVPSQYTTRIRQTCWLPIGETPEATRAGYGKSIRRQLRKYGPVHLEPAAPEEIITTYRRFIGPKAGLQEKHYDSIRRLMAACGQRDAAICYRALDADGQIVNLGFFPHYRGTIINLFPTSTEHGYRTEGMLRTLDAVITGHGVPGGKMDFEGSDIPGIMHFFQKFNPVTETYLEVTRTPFRR